MDTDHENTWRGLKGDPLVMKLSCRLGLHRWTTWKLDTTIKTVPLYRQKKIEFHYEGQCVDCNILRWKKGRKPHIT